VNFWAVAYKVSLGVLVLLLIVAAFAWILPKIRLCEEREEKIATLEDKNKQIESAIGELKNKQDHFATDPEYVERVAREELSKAKPGETIYRYIDKKTNTIHK
jgi:cell division protein FtsB